MTMVTSDEGIALIKAFEGFQAHPYRDTGGLWTVGYGHKVVSGDGVVINDYITPVQGTSLLRHDVAVAEIVVNKLVKVPLNQNQFDALVSFTYNLGGGNLLKSTLLKVLNAGDYDRAASEFLKWDYVAGAPNEAIANRRRKESTLFSTGVYPT